MKPQLLISSVSSGSGKTLFTLGLLRALKERDMEVQSFKCGPDYTDPHYHTIATGREVANLDRWMASKHHIQSIYNQYAEDADICITEGMMGLFDGYKRMQGSSAEIAKLLNIPIILVINARSAAYSIAPLLYGFKNFRRDVRIIGVIFNQVASLSHYNYLKDACKDAGIESLGYLPYSEKLRMPTRYQGFTLTVKQGINDLITQVTEQINQSVDIDKLLNLSTRPFPCAYNLPYIQETPIEQIGISRKKIAIARDAAFCFTYAENLNRLKEKGALTFFSPLYSKELPEADFIYLPGGYPELFARQLHRNKKLMQQLHAYIENGGKVFAECGGMAYLSRELITARGTSYEMTGILPVTCTMANARLHQGYRYIEYNGNILHGHEFHYSNIMNSDNLSPFLPQYNSKGNKTETPLYRYKNLITGYTHWYWGETDLMKLWE